MKDGKRTKVVVVSPEHKADQELLDKLCEIKILSDAISWGNSQTPIARTAEVVAQDEYTFDVIISHESDFLVFDTT